MNNYLLYKNLFNTYEFQISLLPIWNSSSKIYYFNFSFEFYIDLNNYSIISGNDMVKLVLSLFPNYKNLLLNYKSKEINIIKSNTILNDFLNDRILNFKNIDLITKEIIADDNDIKEIILKHYKKSIQKGNIL